jgi:8-oxo-dGTP pyrophosphatase MutT (NUDIX family)
LRPLRLPPELTEVARGFLDGSLTPARLRDASTVVLLREGDGRPGGLEVYLLRRTVDMAFAAGFCVFPGGGVDPRDYDAEVGWAGPSVTEWAGLLRTDEEHARALVCAAVRETFEESGVLLAGNAADSVVADTTGDDWEQDRRRLEARELPFTRFLADRGLVLRTDLLTAWGTWVTPVVEPKRYDTRFFVAVLPAGQTTRDVSRESDEVRWTSVSEAAAAVAAGRLQMLPPTYATCLELAEFGTTAEVVAAAADRDLTPVRPQLALDHQGAYLALPGRVLALGEPT